MIRILIADDHPLVRMGLRQMLARHEDMVVQGEAEDYSGILARLREAEYDILLLDVSLPGKNGIEILKSLREIYPTLKALVISTHPENQYGLRALRAGAAGYLTKSISLEHLVEAVREIAAGRRYISKELAGLLADSMGRKDPDAPAHETLSDRELQTLRLIAAGRKPADIATELALSPKTVSVYRARILEKLGLKSNAELARYAQRHGLVE
jgi:DNA-binding NarL/FixJ family response regulator